MFAFIYFLQISTIEKPNHGSFFFLRRRFGLDEIVWRWTQFQF